MWKKVLEILNGVKAAWAFITAFGVTGGVILTFLVKMPPWVRLSILALALAGLSSFVTVLVYRRRVVRPLSDAFDRGQNMLVLMNKTILDNDKRDSGQSWPPHRALVFTVPPSNGTALTVSVKPNLAAVIEFDIEVLNCAPFPVRVLEFDITFEAESVRRFRVHEKFLKRTGWDAIGQKQWMTMKVEVRVPLQYIEAKLPYVRIGVSGHAVVASEEWDGETRVNVAGFMRSLVKDSRTRETT